MFNDDWAPLKLPRLQQVLDEHQARGEHTGALLSLSIQGQVLEWCDGNLQPGVCMTQEAVIPWLSAGKPLTAVAVARLWQDRHLDLDDPVARWVPAFAERGKDDISLRHVLTHTGGFASMFDIDGRAESWQHAVQRVCASRPRWQPGQRAAYQPRSGWQILGEVVRIVSGAEVHEYVAETVLRPAEMHNTWLWLPSVDAGSVVVAPLTDTSATTAAASAEGTDGEMAIPGVMPYCSPGAGACGTVADLRRFYQALLQPGGLLEADTMTLLTDRHRAGMLDESFRHIVDWGLGFVLDSNRYGPDTVPYGYGRHCSDRTFGHGGSQCCTGFADPDHGLAVALAVNGRPGEAAHGARFRRALTALYEDLELARTS